MKCLVIGGGGPVGMGLLYLAKQLGWTTAVVDPKRPRHMDVHEKLLAGSLLGWTAQPYGLDELDRRLAAERFDIVFDLSPTMDKRRSIGVCDARGVSLVNSTMVDCKDDIHIAAYNFVDSRPTATRRPHIVASGMNPGGVNAMAEEIIRRYEQPDAICYWEYDDTLPGDGRLPGPATTWSQGESGAEIQEDWTFEVEEEGTLLMHEDALSWPSQRFRSCGVPTRLLGIPAGADAFLIGHEECIYMGWRHDTAVKFVYGFHKKNMDLMRAAGYGWQPHLLVQDGQRSLVGRDLVGVTCRYADDDTWVGLYCELANSPRIPSDTNATCILVAAGVAASGLHLEKANVKPGVHLTHELRGWMKAFRSLVTVRSYEIEGNKAELEQEPPPRASRPRSLVARWLDGAPAARR
jgi:hypothetical protein